MTGEGGKRYLLLLVFKMENSKMFVFGLNLQWKSLAELEVEAVTAFVHLFHTLKLILR